MITKETVVDQITVVENGTVLYREATRIMEDGKELTPAVEAVFEDREVPDYQGVDTSFLVATLTAAIQEQQAQIANLSARLTSLENK